MKVSRLLFIVASFLWLIWGLFHILGGYSLITALQSAGGNIPSVVDLEMMGEQMPFYLLQTLKEHAFNNVWFGVSVTIAAVFGFMQKDAAIYFCSIVGGLAHFGFTLFLVIPGNAPFMGSLFSFLVALAIVLGFMGIYLKSKGSRG